MKLNADLHDDLEASPFDADDDFAFDAPANEQDRGGAMALASADALEPVERPEPHAMADRLAEAFAGADDMAGEVMVPRIVIHAFCERDDTAALIGSAADDRRLSRATVEVRSGGLSAALQRYQVEPTPSLVMVESGASAARLLSELDSLAEVCDPGTKVMVIGAANDIALYRELIRRGVSDYLVPPLKPLQLIRAVSDLYSDPSAPFVGRSIAFIGAKGGVGASTVAHNVAHALTERLHANAVIVDFDLPFGTAGLDFNQDPTHGVVDALGQPDRLDPTLLDRMMVRCTDRLSLFAAPATLDADYDFAPEAYEEVAGKIRTTAPFIVLDLPHLWSAWMRRTVLSADEVVIVATPDLASLRNAKNMVDLIRQARPNDAPPRLVLNQVGVPGRPEIPVKEFGAALAIEPALVLPFDPKTFGQAANNGQMIAEVAAKTKSAEGLAHLAHVLSRREAPVAAAKPKASLFAKLLKKA